MMTTVLSWGALAGGGILVSGVLIWVAARIVGIETANLFGRSMLTALFCGIISAAVIAIVLIATNQGGVAGLPAHVQWLSAILVVLFCVVVLRNGLESTFPRAVAVWCCAIGMAAMLALVALPGLAVLGDVLDAWAAGPTLATR
jgi:hypothetical protein